MKTRRTKKNAHKTHQIKKRVEEWRTIYLITIFNPFKQFIHFIICCIETNLIPTAPPFKPIKGLITHLTLCKQAIKRIIIMNELEILFPWLFFCSRLEDDLHENYFHPLFFLPFSISLSTKKRVLLCIRRQSHAILRRTQNIETHFNGHEEKHYYLNFIFVYNVVLSRSNKKTIEFWTEWESEKKAERKKMFQHWRR